jgi:hypothetical protein
MKNYQKASIEQIYYLMPKEDYTDEEIEQCMISIKEVVEMMIDDIKFNKEHNINK